MATFKMTMMVVMKMLYEKITLVRMSTDSPPIEAPKIVFTIAKATTPPSAPVDCVDHDDYDDNIEEEGEEKRHRQKDES